MITDPSRFVGRREELALLARRMGGAQPTSVNVVGERRIGKSSLLSHFFQTWEQRVNTPTRFVVVYLDLQAKTPPSESAFYQALGRVLVKQPAVQRIESLRKNLLAPPRSHQDFVSLLEQFADYVLLPVFCLDEFEVLLKSGEQFTDVFFDRLRGCMNASQLMFILSSRRPLDVYAGEHDLTSAFFNLGHVVALGEFSEEEAEELVGLPVDGESALDPEERQLALDWGGRHPLRLQLAGLSLWEAREDRKNIRWAKAEFGRQCKHFVPQKTKRSFSVTSCLRTAFRDFPRWLGSWPLRIGRIMSDTANFIVGWMIILVVLACVFGYLPVADLFAFVAKRNTP